MTKKFKLSRLLALSFVLVLGTAGCFVFSRSEYKQSIERLESSIREATPIGLSAQQICQNLDAEKIEHSRYSERDRSVLAIWRNVEYDFFVSASLQAEYTFDGHGLLSRIRFNPVFTGL